MKTDEQILSEIGAVARQHLQREGDLRLDQRLVEDLELDSLSSLTLAVEVENHFRICLDPASEEQIVTVDDLVAAVRSKLEASRTDPD